MNLSKNTILSHKGTLGFWSTLFTYIKVNIVAGFLFLPMGFHDGGWLFSIIAIGIVAAINVYCNIAIAECTGPAQSYSLSKIGQRAMGRFGYYSTEFGLAISQVKNYLT